MNVGLFGGTFDPIHLGHLRSAAEVRRAFGLDRISFVPSASPPHKPGQELAPAEHRYAMVALAIADEPTFAASRIELDRPGPSFSVDTLRTFRADPSVGSLAFIIGVDAFAEIGSWHAFAEIPTLCDLIVTSRPGVATPAVERLIPVALRPAFWYDAARHRYQHDSGHSLTLYMLNGLPISASDIRVNLRSGRSTQDQIPSVVAEYIARHGLYRRREDAGLEG